MLGLAVQAASHAGEDLRRRWAPPATPSWVGHGALTSQAPELPQGHDAPNLGAQDPAALSSTDAHGREAGCWPCSRGSHAQVSENGWQPWQKVLCEPGQRGLSCPSRRRRKHRTRRLLSHQETRRRTGAADTPTPAGGAAWTWKDAGSRPSTGPSALGSLARLWSVREPEGRPRRSCLDSVLGPACCRWVWAGLPGTPLRASAAPPNPLPSPWVWLWLRSWHRPPAGGWREPKASLPARVWLHGGTAHPFC